MQFQRAPAGGKTASGGATRADRKTASGPKATARRAAAATNTPRGLPWYKTIQVNRGRREDAVWESSQRDARRVPIDERRAMIVEEVNLRSSIRVSDICERFRVS